MEEYEMIMKELKEAADTIYKKGYVLENMEYDDSQYELVRVSDAKTVIDHLSMSQVIQIANIL